ncbi:hypothetical protein [Myxacorys almedinensis]|uniref:Capsule polysaccharide biosynthesis protein n=1 Tax=Myxacorys almedinensis A TaxID=2690445 RepID=A0A8J7Z6E1_9CYAN|nr:hypothetical protein [Myxacorys almedinensis]NDJ18746.1 hypothetical protein [Myxacorys almedinensis A]
MSLDFPPLSDSLVADRDRLAWNAICNWSKHTQTNPIDDGIDYAELTRCFLWDKVARAIRRQSNPQQFEFEQALLDRRSQIFPLVRHPNRLKSWLKRSLTFLQTSQDARSLPAGKILYVPCPHPTLQTAVSAIARSFTVVTPQGGFKDVLGLHPIRPPLPSDLPNVEHVESLHHGIVTGLQELGIELIEQDAIALRHQIAQLLLRTGQIEAELSILRPDAILLFADNHFPVQSYVFVARKKGIPTIMLQHGLDCEHYCLDEAYADVISVWGTSRLQRYQDQSTWKPTIQVNGNPDYDRLTLPENLDFSGSYWLWATRPHCPEKCYSPSRTPQEGIQILEALLTALAQSPNSRLVIKPHPMDDLALYQSYIESHSVEDRVSIVSESVRSLFPDASVVISEDSTIGLEAMFFGKVLIHAHFAPSEPVIPLVQYNAALVGYSSKLLQTALQEVDHLSEAQQQQLFSGQRRFLQEYAGICDGQAQKRVTAMIQTVLEP